MPTTGSDSQAARSRSSRRRLRKIRAGAPASGRAGPGLMEYLNPGRNKFGVSDRNELNQSSKAAQSSSPLLVRLRRPGSTMRSSESTKGVPMTVTARYTRPDEGARFEMPDGAHIAEASAEETGGAYDLRARRRVRRVAHLGPLGTNGDDGGGGADVPWASAASSVPSRSRAARWLITPAGAFGDLFRALVNKAGARPCRRRLDLTMEMSRHHGLTERAGRPSSVPFVTSHRAW